MSKTQPPSLQAEQPWHAAASLLIRFSHGNSRGCCACCRLPLAEVLQAVSRAAPRYHVHAQPSSGCSCNGWVAGSGAVRRRLQLHPCFASSLRLAQVCDQQPHVQCMLRRAIELMCGIDMANDSDTSLLLASMSCSVANHSLWLRKGVICSTILSLPGMSPGNRPLPFLCCYAQVIPGLAVRQAAGLEQLVASVGSGSSRVPRALSPAARRHRSPQPGKVLARKSPDRMQVAAKAEPNPSLLLYWLNQKEVASWWQSPASSTAL